jgi:hypothetical protein
VTSFINGTAPAKIRPTSVTAGSTTISSTVSGLTAGTAYVLTVSVTNAGGSGSSATTAVPAPTSSAKSTPGDGEVAPDGGHFSLGGADLCGSLGGESRREAIVAIANGKGSS